LEANKHTLVGFLFYCLCSKPGFKLKEEFFEIEVGQAGCYGNKYKAVRIDTWREFNVVGEEQLLPDINTV
jgi:hypothetical protein